MFASNLRPGAAMIVAILLVSCRSLSPNGSVVKEGWTEGQDDPAQLPPITKEQVHRFSDLSFRGFVSPGRFTGNNFDLSFRDNTPHILWNSSYWPLGRGGVAARWQRGDQRPPQNLAPFEPSRMQSTLDLNALSPIEKYDIVSGQFDFRSTKRELSRRPTSGATQWAGWEGYCHGWAAAALKEEAPVRPFSVKIPDSNQSIQFEPDDVKALLSKLYGDYIAGGPVGSGRISIVGAQCPESDSELLRKIDPMTRRLVGSLFCTDVNPGTLQVLMSYIMGTQVPESLREPMVLETNPASETWNTPVVSYDTVFRQHSMMKDAGEVEALKRLMNAGNSELLGNNPGCKKRIEIDKQLGMWKYRGDGGGQRVACIVDLSMSVWYLSFTTVLPVTNHTQARIQKDTYNYSVELDSDGNVIGGEWDWGGAQGALPKRPDSIWKPNINYNTIGFETEDAVVNWNNMQKILEAAKIRR